MGRGCEGRELTSLKPEKILGGYLMSKPEKLWAKVTRGGLDERAGAEKKLNIRRNLTNL